MGCTTRSECTRKLKGIACENIQNKFLPLPWHRVTRCKNEITGRRKKPKPVRKPAVSISLKKFSETEVKILL